MTHDAAPGASERAVVDEVGARHGLWAPGTPARVEARGPENTTIAVGHHVLRRTADLDAAAREVALLRALAPATDVPVPVPLVHDAGRGLVVYRRLPGTPLLRRPGRAHPSVVAGLVDVLAALRAVRPDPPPVVDDEPVDAWHAEALRVFEAVRRHLSPGRADVVAARLAALPPEGPTRLRPQHGDLGAEHLLVDADGALTGVIDWTDAAVTDPARDLGRIYRDLGPEAARQVADRLDGKLGTADEERVRFHARCAWLEDVEHGLHDPHARRAYLTNADRTFAHVFAAP
ncbi:phosphotransferase family protein [Cellulosimicrobium marinum]|uniref:phosphotransferase family protein n=1 Tax=Cellulosimicrobium marinum TaxID=1638992 RepID=UPI001E3B4C40|nr:aminoglycoside phosphotransferase family protein [Cellulosimicrobium marinum]MCB7137462.1 aminoglycoside phosphotransferase family protein [Cellulosimicrobium marinum]